MGRLASMMLVECVVACALACVLAACAAAGEGVPDAQGSGTSDGRGSDGSSGTTTSCPTDQLATDVGATKLLTCTTIDGAARQAMGDHCSAYLGWLDNCDGCTTAPTKWGRAGGSCSPGAGVNNTCTMPSLGGVPVHLFGLDLEGDMDGNDKLHAGLHCSANTANDTMTPCPAGQFVDGFNGTNWTCTSFAKSLVAYVQASCSIYLGWQDGCNGCTSPPTKWGYTSSAACTNGAGADNTCNPPTLLGAESVRLFGVNPDGDVDGNDKLHVGLRCEPIAPATSTQTRVCPAGHFVTSTMPDGSFRCESAAPLIERYFAERCTLYFGWHDGCQGCTTPPTKWGSVRVGACANGAGADNTCSKLTLGQPVDMFGLSPDGDVDENDVLYVGFRCD